MQISQTSEFPNMNDKYVKLQRLAEGAYGVIYKGRDNTDGQLVAMKKFKKLNNAEGIPKNCLREIQMLRMLEGVEQVIQIKDVVMNQKGSVMIIYEFHEASLQSFLGVMGSAYNPKKFLREILHAVSVIHDYNIIHRDLKPANILMNKAGLLRLADFGMARQLQDVMTNQVGTSHYRAPELIYGETKYTKAIDIWAVGCIFYELLKRAPLFQGKSQADVIFKIGTLLGVPKTAYNGPNSPKIQLPTPDEALRQKAFQGIAEDALDLLLKMLDINPKTRMSAEQALKHRYFNESNKTQKAAF